MRLRLCFLSFVLHSLIMVIMVLVLRMSWLHMDGGWMNQMGWVNVMMNDGVNHSRLRSDYYPVAGSVLGFVLCLLGLRNIWLIVVVIDWSFGWVLLLFGFRLRFALLALLLLLKIAFLSGILTPLGLVWNDVVVIRQRNGALASQGHKVYCFLIPLVELSQRVTSLQHVKPRVERVELSQMRMHVEVLSTNVAEKCSHYYFIMHLV